MKQSIFEIDDIANTFSHLSIKRKQRELVSEEDFEKQTEKKIKLDTHLDTHLVDHFQFYFIYFI